MEGKCITIDLFTWDAGKGRFFGPFCARWETVKGVNFGPAQQVGLNVLIFLVRLYSLKRDQEKNSVVLAPPNWPMDQARELSYSNRIRF